MTRLRNNRFEVLLSEEVDGLAAYPDQLFVRLTQRFVRIGLDGSVRNLGSLSRRDLTIDASGRLWYVSIDKRACWIDPNHLDEFHCTELPTGYEFQQVASDSKGRIWAADGEQAVLLEGHGHHLGWAFVSGRIAGRNAAASPATTAESIHPSEYPK